MTSNEAITLLRTLEDKLDSYCELNEEGKTAFRMAIEALSSSEIPNNSDLISRQAAIDALRKLREEDIEDYGCEIPEGFNQDHLDRATFAIKQLPPIQPEPHWIPVTERLPDKEERDYWICTDDGYQCQCKWTDDIGFGHHDIWRWSGKPQYSKVTAWMPLPEVFRG